MFVDAAASKPLPDNGKDLDGLTKEKSRLIRVVKIEVGINPGSVITYQVTMMAAKTVNWASRSCSLSCCVPHLLGIAFEYFVPKNGPDV